MELRPVTLREARRFIGEHHRHNLPPRGWRFGVAAWEGDRMVGVGIAGRPVARGLDNGTTLEVIRTCTDGTANANSLIYGALCRAAKALGYQRVVTYTLASESGASLRAAGFVADAALEERESWQRYGACAAGGGTIRYQEDIFGEARRPPDEKIRWLRTLQLPRERRNHVGPRD